MFVSVFPTLDGNIHCGSQFQSFQTLVTLPHASGPGEKAHHEYKIVKAGGQIEKSPYSKIPFKGILIL